MTNPQYDRAVAACLRISVEKLGWRICGRQAAGRRAAFPSPIEESFTRSEGASEGRGQQFPTGGSLPGSAREPVVRRREQHSDVYEGTSIEGLGIEDLRWEIIVHTELGEKNILSVGSSAKDTYFHMGRLERGKSGPGASISGPPTGQQHC